MGQAPAPGESKFEVRKIAKESINEEVKVNDCRPAERATNQTSSYEPSAHLSACGLPVDERTLNGIDTIP